MISDNQDIDNEKEKKDEIIEKISKEVELKQSDNIIQIKI